MSNQDYEFYERGTFGRLILRNCNNPKSLLTPKTLTKLLTASNKYAIIEKKNNLFTIRLFSDWNLKTKITEIKNIEENKINQKVRTVLDI